MTWFGVAGYVVLALALVSWARRRDERLAAAGFIVVAVGMILKGMFPEFPVMVWPSSIIMAIGLGIVLWFYLWRQRRQA